MPDDETQYPYRWNYVEDKTYPCNETIGDIIRYLKKAKCDTTLTNNPLFVEHLWHILYSVEDKQELRTALTHFSAKNNLNEQFVDVFSNMPPYEKEYGAYSAKAIKKILPLMRMGRYWNEANIDNATKSRINKIINGECDENISNRVREKLLSLTSIKQFRALPLWLACYVVYNRHSEYTEASRWTSPDDIDAYLKNFKQHSLRNPIVENVVLETLRVVRDLWRKYGHIDEIHIELGREMKNPAKVRKAMAKRNQKNEEANIRAKILLEGLTNPKYEIENIHPFSPKQQERMHIYEDMVLNNSTISKDILQIIEKFTKSEKNEEKDENIDEEKDDKKRHFTEADVERYIHWLDQKYTSPYTGQVIPLKKLFTTAYEIDHIIPQSRYFDDSFSNKVICETEVNKLKSNKLGYEFIKQHKGEIVQLSNGHNVQILTPEIYAENIEQQYRSNRTKMRKLLMEDIPDDFIKRQLNDSRYISSFIKSLLSNIVREEGETEATSKNVIVVSGAITSRLKKDWGMNDVWSHIILPRFKRLNELTETNVFTAINTNGHEIPSMPIELLKGFNKKRIDHRHHAMDAIVIACTTREHVNLLNNEAALSKNKDYRCQLLQKLRQSKVIKRNGVCKRVQTSKVFKKPWKTFTTDVENMLKETIVSFKQNLRVINKTTNYYQHFENGKKTIAVQKKGDSWAIRKPMHEDTIFGEINIRLTKSVTLQEAIEHTSDIKNKMLKCKIGELIDKQYDLEQIQHYFKENSDKWSNINLEKIEIYYFTNDTNERFLATRKPIDKSFTESKINKSIADSAIQKILMQHLKRCGSKPQTAFSPDGINRMNSNIVALNDGHPHQPIYKVRTHKKSEKMFAIGKQGNKAKMFVKTAGGTNLFFAIYETETIDSKTGETKKERSYATIPLNVAIDRIKQGLPPATNNANGIPPKYVLSPNDLVYVPTPEELKGGHITHISDYSRIYRFVSCDNTTANFVPHSVANVILSMGKEDAEKFCKGKDIIQNEFGMGSKQSKNQKATTKEMIKESCIPIKVTRLGEYSF